MDEYWRRFWAVLGVLVSLAYALPTPAANGQERPPHTARVRFEQFLAPASPSYAKAAPVAAVGSVTDTSGGGYRWLGPPAAAPDWRGIKWDTGYFLGYQFAVIGILYVAPEELSGWSEEDKDDYSFEKWKENVSNPVWDEDAWWVNYILHPYWGGTYYIRARERGFERLQSFWYAVLLSTLYEYGAEALFEPVSYQDLVVTPVAGALLGEYVFTPIRERIRARSTHLAWPDKAVLFMTDPLGVVNQEVNRMLGLNAVVSFRPLGMEGIRPASGPSGASQVGLPARLGNKPVWGLQLKIRW
jgi:hypothetical protein